MGGRCGEVDGESLVFLLSIGVCDVVDWGVSVVCVMLWIGMYVVCVLDSRSGRRQKAFSFVHTSRDLLNSLLGCGSCSVRG